MAHIAVKKEVLGNLAGKTVIITGGANGIGKATVLLLHELGANIVIGDLDVKGGEALLQDIKGKGLFQRTDVTDWASLKSLFSRAREKFGDIHTVFANAGIPEREPLLFEDKLDEHGELAEPDLRILDINIGGVIRTIKLAIHFFAKNTTPGGALAITGSAASYFGSTPIVRYCATKHAVLGLVRATAAMTKAWNVRINLVAPWMTETEFSSEVSTIWGDMPKNTSREVAEALCMAVADPSLNGRSLYVAKEIVDFELPLRKTEDQWMSPKQAVWFDAGRRRLAEGMGFPGAHYLEQ